MTVNKKNPAGTEPAAYAAYLKDPADLFKTKADFPEDPAGLDRESMKALILNWKGLGDVKRPKDRNHALIGAHPPEAEPVSWEFSNMEAFFRDYIARYELKRETIEAVRYEGLCIADMNAIPHCDDTLAERRQAAQRGSCSRSTVHAACGRAATVLLTPMLDFMIEVLQGHPEFYRMAVAALDLPDEMKEAA